MRERYKRFVCDYRHYHSVRLELRQAWFLNYVLPSMESWHNLKDQQLKELKVLYRYLLRKMQWARSKVPEEFLYLETSAISIDFILTGHQLNYLHTILSRGNNEFTKKI